MECFIRTLQNDALNIHLEDQKEIEIGRVTNPDAFDKNCSRYQISICANYKKRLARIRCVGSNPSAIDNKLLNTSEEDNLFPDQTLYLVNKLYPLQLIFKDSPSNDCDQPPNKALKLDHQAVDKDSITEKKDDPDVNEKLHKFQELFKMRPAAVKPQSEEIVKSLCANSGTPTGWVNESNSCLIYTGQGVKDSNKIAAFDMDYTVIATASGRVFPKDIHDWRLWAPEVPGRLKKLNSEGYKVIIFSNQRWVSTGKLTQKDLKTKIENINAKLNVPLQCFFALDDDKYRKPRMGMWELLESKYNGGIAIDKNESLYVGDAAGRPVNWEPKQKKDHSCSDRLFALNLSIPFQTPEEFFLKQKTFTNWTRPTFDPYSFRKLMESQSTVDYFTKPDKPELALLVGLPASGKSTVVKQQFLPSGYKSVSRDNLNSWQKCVAHCSSLLSSGDYVVIDNTNVDKVSRARYIEVAKSLKIPVRCFKMEVTPHHCQHNEKFRELIGDDHAKISDMIFNQLKSKYEEPTLAEGFADLISIPFVPKFKSKAEESLYFQYLLER